MLKKMTWAAGMAAALLLAACSPADKPSAQPDTAHPPRQTTADGKPVYIVATDAAYAPFEYMEGDQVVGFSHDILQAAGDKEGIVFEFVNTPFEGIFANVDKGDSDVALASITITDERKQIVDFTDPYFEATQMIVTRGKRQDIQSFADLKNQRVSVQNGTTADLILQELQGKDSRLIRRFDNMPLAFKELSTGGVDVTVGDNGVVQYFVAQNPGDYHMFVDAGFAKEQYGFALKKGRSDDLRERINRGLAAIKADGTYARIEARWFKK